MFDHSEVWRSLDYRERIVVTLIMLELSAGGGISYIDTTTIEKDAQMSREDFREVCVALFDLNLLDVDDAGNRLCLKGKLKELYETEVLHRRKR